MSHTTTKHVRSIGLDRQFRRRGDYLLGISDPWIWGVYVLSLLSALLCVSYGAINWNKGSEKEPEEIQEEIRWEDEEQEMEEGELGL